MVKVLWPSAFQANQFGGANQNHWDQPLMVCDRGSA
jgi:hypothetical protein